MLSFGMIPAPVLPVIAFMWISSSGKLNFTLGINPNKIAVAKQPGFAIFLLLLIIFLLISGSP